MAYQPKSYRKFIATGVATAMVATAVAPAVSANFPDVDQDLWHAEYINFAFERGFIEGDPSGDFRPFENMTRAEAVTVVLRMLGENPNELEDVTTTTFPDTTGDQWWSPAIERAVELGVVQGKADGNFHPGANLTRAEFAEMLFNAFDIEADEDNMVEFDDLVEDDWYEEAIMALASNGIIEGDGDGTFRPNDDVQRNESAAMVQRTVLLIEGEDEDEDPAEVEGLTVTNVSAISGVTFEMTANFDEDVEEEDLEGTSLTLEGPAGELTAAFSEMDNGVAVFTVTDTAALKPGDGSADGTYEVTSDSFNVSEGLATTYGEILTANVIQGFVFSDSVLDGGEEATEGRVEGATVTVGDRSVTTDARGYYAVPANPGLRTVTISAPGHYSETSNVNVNRNYATALNADLIEFDRERLHITGQALDSETNETISGARVKLEKNYDGDWETVATVETKENGDGQGQFVFHNSAIDPSDVENYEDAEAAGFDNDYLNLGDEYRIVVEKTIEDDLFDNYHSVTVDAFELSEQDAQTDLASIELDQVEEIQEFNFEVDFASNLTTTSNTLQVELLATDGRKVLQPENTTTPDSGVIEFDVVRDEDNNLEMADALDLVDEDFYHNGDNAIRLPDGTYFMRIVNMDGGAPVNAVTLVAVEVEEGKVVTTPVETIRQERIANIDAAIGNVRYQDVLDLYTTGDTIEVTNDEDPLTRDTGNDVEINFNVTKTINGVDVYVYDEEASNALSLNPQTFTYNESPVTIEAGTFAVNNLASGSYNALPIEEYLRGDAVTIEAGAALSSSDATFGSAAKLAQLNLEDEETGDTLTTGDGVHVNSIALIDSDGNEVAEVTDFLAEDASDLEDLFEGIAPSQYRLRIDVEGYEVKTTSLRTYFDFQDVEVDAELEAIEETSVSGTIRFESNNQRAVTTSDSATVALYDATGQLSHAQYVDSDSTFSLVHDDGGRLLPGTYTMVVRGSGFETKSLEIEVEEGENRQNLQVVQGGDGLARLSLRDSNGLPVITDSAVLRDANFTTSAHSSVDTDLDFLGEYDLEDTTQTAVYVASDLAAGDYTVRVPGTDTTNLYETDLRIQNINDTVLRVLSIPARSEEPEVPVEITLNNTETDPINYVRVYNQDNELVRTKRDIDGMDELTVMVPQNATYTVRAFSNDKFVGESNVTVQDFTANVTISLNDAVR